jgi:hypothetical protein
VVGECDDADTIHALAAAHRAVTVGTVPAPAGVVGLPLVAGGEDAPRPVMITLHAAWEASHYAAELLSDLAARLEQWTTRWREGLSAARE